MRLGIRGHDTTILKSFRGSERKFEKTLVNTESRVLSIHAIWQKLIPTGPRGELQDPEK